MSLNYQAYNYLLTFFNGAEYPDGLSLRAKLQELDLDFSLESLRRIDTLLDKIRPKLNLRLEQFILKQANLNFLLFLNFYVGETIRRQTDATVNWLTFDEAASYWPEFAQQQRSFDNSIICFFNCSGLGTGVSTLPLAVIVTRMFDNDQHRTLALVQHTIEALARKPLLLRINPEACLRALPQEQWSYPEVPVPGWVMSDPLKRNVAQCKQLWLGGKVVWGRIVQANNALFAPGDGALLGEVVYDARGGLDYTDLIEAASNLMAMRGTAKVAPELASLAVYLSGGWVRAFGVPVPASICRVNAQHGPRVMMSTVLFHRPHLPNGQLSLPYFPLLIHDKFPGTVMVLPSQWWPQELIQRWQFKA